MRDISDSELNRMSGSLNMQDTCQLVSYSGTFDSYNDPVAGYTTGSAISCSYDPTASNERRTFELTQVSFTASVRLPTGTSVDEKDLLLVTQRHGDPISLSPYNVVGEARIRPTHVLVLLDEVHS